MELKTPLYDRHVAAGGRMVPYAGYLLPVQYKGIIEEHMAVRTACGLFDVSHMGEVLLAGPAALANLNRLLTNDFSNLAAGRVRYSPLCNEAGGVLDDVLVYRLGQDRYLVVVNAANRHKDVAWIRDHIAGDCAMEDASDRFAQLALQGPAGRDILARVADAREIPARYYSFTEHLAVAGIDCLVSRTGYTGEAGYELYCAPGHAPALWDALLEAGRDLGLVPCGLGARDTLRLEAAMPLYGHEMDESITPLETGLGFAVKLGKPDFIGKAALVEKGEPAVSRVGIKITGRGIARENCQVWAGERKVGRTTSGTHCPFLGGAYAMALVERTLCEPGTAVQVDVRGRRIDGEIVELPFYPAGK